MNILLKNSRKDKMEATQIRFECEQFKKLMLQKNPNIMIYFLVFDVNEHCKDTTKGE